MNKSNHKRLRVHTNASIVTMTFRTKACHVTPQKVVGRVGPTNTVSTVIPSFLFMGPPGRQTPNRPRIQVTIGALQKTKIIPTTKPANQNQEILPNQQITPTAMIAIPAIGATIVSTSAERAVPPLANGAAAQASSGSRRKEATRDRNSRYNGVADLWSFVAIMALSRGSKALKKSAR